MGNHILVIGATLLDAKGIPEAGLEPGTSNPARYSLFPWRYSAEMWLKIWRDWGQKCFLIHRSR